MKTKSVFISGAFTTALLARALVAPAPAGNEPFSLAHAVPNDVFMYTTWRNNPERAFIQDYWNEVFQAFKDTGITDDIIGLVAPLLSAEQTAEFTRLKERAQQLIAGVDWEKMCGTEGAFTERMNTPDLSSFAAGRAPVMMPDMVWMFRGSKEGAAENYKGLVAILEGIADEVGKATGSRAMHVEKGTQAGAEVASMDLMAMAIGAPQIRLHIAHRDNLIIAGMRDTLFDDVLNILDKSGDKKSLADDPRFKNAFKQLPAPEDTMTFFDARGMMRPMRKYFDAVLNATVKTGDVTQNGGMSEEAGELNAQAIKAYRKEDYKTALKLIEQAYEKDSESSIVQYNLACFNSLNGNPEKALEWLNKAIDAGFYAPAKISGDSDFTAIRNDPAFKTAIEKARKLAAANSVKDVILNGPKEGEAWHLVIQAWRAHGGKEYEQGLKLAEQAYAVAPEHSRVLYALACFHSLLGHEDRALDYLEKAVDRGYCCPNHISKDADLDAIRDNQRYKLAVAKAKEKAIEMADTQGQEWGSLARNLFNTVFDSVAIMDYTAAVETTDAYSTKMVSLTRLVPGAQDKPVYALFGHKKSMTDFAKFLPEETESFSLSGGFDINALYQFLEDTVRAVKPKGDEVLQKWAGIQKSLGIDVRKDILSWIDGDSIHVTLAGGKGTVMLMKVNDESKAREMVASGMHFAMEQLTKILGEVPKANPSLAPFTSMLSVRTSPVTDESLEGFENIHFSLSPQPLVWGVAEGYLIFGSSADAVSLCLDTARGKHPNIKENAQIMSEAIVPDGPFVMLSLADKRRVGKEVAAVTTMLSVGIGMAGNMAPNPKLKPIVTKIAGMMGKVASVAQRVDFYKSTAKFIQFDGQGWRTNVVTHYFSPEERQSAANN